MKDLLIIRHFGSRITETVVLQTVFALASDVIDVADQSQVACIYQDVIPLAGPQ